ncbi:MAG: hypothetical protein KGO47_07395 [Cyanobacteria bacterium REEB417]|nr:hypothetical protein [Cyanobacteria bacterium REEB417]
MSTDARAYAWCNLGLLAPEGSSVAESHVQGSGVITYRGTINLSGVYRPAPGTVVELAYSDGQNWIARLPVRLRVLSSFANPLQGKTTAVSVGCDLAYFEDRKRPPNSYTARAANPNVPDSVWRWVPPAISAFYVAGRILSELGIEAANGIPLTNRYVREEFDMSEGYVEELGKLAASECYAVRMNPDGLLEFIKKNPTELGTSVLILQDDLIDFNQINSGDLPGDVVEVTSDSKSLKNPEFEVEYDLDRTGTGSSPSNSGQTLGFTGSLSAAGGSEFPGSGAINLPGEPVQFAPTDPLPPFPSGRVLPTGNRIAGPNDKKRNWEKDETIGRKEVHVHNYTKYITTPTGAVKQRKNNLGWKLFVGGGDGEVSDIPLVDPVYETKAAQYSEKISYYKKITTETTYDELDRVLTRVTKTQGLWTEEVTITEFEYITEIETYVEGNASSAVTYLKDRKKDGGIKREITTVFSAVAPVMMACGFQLSYSELKDGYNGYTIYPSSITEVLYETNNEEGTTKTTTLSSVAYYQTPNGAEQIGRLRDAADERFSRNQSTAEYYRILQQAMRLTDEGVEIRLHTSRNFGVQKRPSEINRVLARNYKETPAEKKEVLKLNAGLGSAPNKAETIVRLQPPYSSDDYSIYDFTQTGVENGKPLWATSYAVVKGNGQQKALEYARTENRLLFGHRNGAGIQVLPELLPAVPLGPIYIRLNNATALFRTNGTTWNIDPQGVTATTDALFWGAIDGSAADAWFPLPSVIATLQASVSISTNSNPKPANAIAIPSGFSFTAPNLSSLFSSLPADTAPVFPRTVTPGVLLKPYHEAVGFAAGGGGGVIVTTQPWAPQTVGLMAGSGAGAALARSLGTVAGGGAGAIASVMPGYRLLAGGGGGVVAAVEEATGPILTFTGGSSMAWDVSNGDNMNYGYSFTLSSARQIKGFGIYDAGGNGLNYGFIVFIVQNLGELWDTVGLEGEGQFYAEIPNGTTAPLVGPWRTVMLENGYTLQPGTYGIVARWDAAVEPLNINAPVDSLIKNASTVTPTGGVTINGPLALYYGNPISTTGDGPGYFGPVLFL